jgi:hypothetical protein
MVEALLVLIEGAFGALVMMVFGILAIYHHMCHLK